MRIINIVGARPNMMKIAPLMDTMRREGDLDPVLVHTGQHYDANMSQFFFDDLGIPDPDHYLGVGSGTQARQTGEVMVRLESLFEELEPDRVLVVGDVNSTVAAALVAAKMGIPLAHVEAGLRSFDRAMPEEINRVVTDALADFLFTTERGAGDNLRNEGISDDRIFFAGNVMIDTLLRHRDRAERLGVAEDHGVEPKGYAVLTLHRPSNVDDPAVLRRLIDVLEEVQARLPVVFPVHPRTHKRLEALGEIDRVRALEGIRLIEPVGYLEFLSLMADAGMVLTDSGGIQEETTILGVPCLTLRENTERPVTVSEGTNTIVGTSPGRILEAVDGALDATPTERRPERWDGRAAERIVEMLRTREPGSGDGA